MQDTVSEQQGVDNESHPSGVHFRSDRVVEILRRRLISVIARPLEDENCKWEGVSACECCVTSNMTSCLVP